FKAYGDDFQKWKTHFESWASINGLAEVVADEALHERPQLTVVGPMPVPQYDDNGKWTDTYSQQNTEWDLLKHQQKDEIHKRHLLHAELLSACKGNDTAFNLVKNAQIEAAAEDKDPLLKVDGWLSWRALMSKYNQVSPSELSKLHTLIRTYQWKGDASNLEPNLGYMIGKFEELKSLEAQRAKTDEQHKKLVYGLDETDKIAAVKAILPK
ncbi:unnamed protein product, partial [Vitrella brassicaformis CCMP3155]